MAKKAKEQVKYDASVSAVKRLKRARNVGVSNAAIIFMRLFMILFIGGYSVVWIISPFIGGVHDDKDSVEMMIQWGTLTFMFTYIGKIVGNIYIDRKMVNKQRATAKGCFSFMELFMTMPVTRLTVQKLEFKEHTLIQLIPTTIVLTIANVYSILFTGYQSFIPECSFSELKGATGLMTLIVNIFILCFFYFDFCAKYSKKNVNRSVFSIFYFVMIIISCWGPLFPSVVKFMSSGGFFEIIAGVPGLVLTAVTVTFVVLYEKLVNEKRLENAPWYFE